MVLGLRSHSSLAAAGVLVVVVVLDGRGNRVHRCCLVGWSSFCGSGHGGGGCVYIFVEII